jgi:hypothetical protein
MKLRQGLSSDDIELTVSGRKKGFFLRHKSRKIGYAQFSPLTA